MGDGMAGNIAKGSVLWKVDAVCNDRTKRPVLLKAVKDQLASDTPSVADFLEHTVGLPGPVVAHFRQHIFRDVPPGWWPTYPEKDRIVLRALEKAIRLAMETYKGDKQRDIDSYWVCAGHQFQTVVTRSRREVNVFYLTPPMPMNICYPSVQKPDDVWISCSEADARGLQTMAGYPVGDLTGHGSCTERDPSELPEMDPGLAQGGVQIVRPNRVV